MQHTGDNTTKTRGTQCGERWRATSGRGVYIPLRYRLHVVGQVFSRQIDVDLFAERPQLHVFFRHLPNCLGGIAGHHDPGRNRLVGFDDTALGYDRPIFDHGPYAEDGTHSDDRQVANGSAMQYGPMPEGNPIADALHIARRAVDDDALLHGRTVADFDPAVIAADNGAVANIAIVSDNNVADNGGQFADLGILADNGLPVVKTVDHKASL